MGKNRNDYTREWMSEMKIRLNKITDNCDVEMHEPDNSGVSARVVGYKLDNAMGDAITESAMMDGWQEYVVIIDNNGERETFNLACLIALARKAQI